MLQTIRFSRKINEVSDSFDISVCRTACPHAAKNFYAPVLNDSLVFVLKTITLQFVGLNRFWLML